MQLAKSLLLYLRHPRDQKRAFSLLRGLGGALVPHYRFTWPEWTWWFYPAFDQYLARFGELEGLNMDRKWMLAELLRLVQAVPGDTAECGAFEGATSYLICRANRLNQSMKRHHFVFDSFEGLSSPGPKDGSYWRKGNLSRAEEVARANLSEFKEVTFLKGWIPSRFEEIKDRRFAFVHIDVDLHDPTRDSLEFFYPRMAPGGIIVCDDYGSRYCPGAIQAVDEFFADKPEKMLEMSGGGGFVICGCPTAPPSFR